MNTYPVKITKLILNIFIIFSSSVFIWPCLGATQVDQLKRVTQKLVSAPFLPKHVQIVTGQPKIVEVRMTIEEKEIEVEPGVFIHAMTFEGNVPGPIIVAHQDDYVELTLVNPSSNKLMHNIDLHAATGALGGGELTKVSPGQTVVLRLKFLNLECSFIIVFLEEQ